MVAPSSGALGILADGLGLVLGLVLVFSGYRLARGLAGLAGFIAGAVLGLGIGAVVAGPIGALVVAVLLGIVLALVFVFAFRFAGAVLGVLAGIAIGTMFAWPTWGVVLAALAGGVLGFVLNKAAIVAWTALAGASIAVESGIALYYAFSGMRFTSEPVVVLASTLVLAALGVLSQMRSLRGENG